MTKQEARFLTDCIRMTYICDPQECGHERDDESGWCKNCNDHYEALAIAVECIEKCIEHEETFEWCHTCKEYDQENHCCYRWSKCIRETAKENEEFYTEKMNEIRFICNFVVGSRHEICDKILAVIDGSDNDD